MGCDIHCFCEVKKDGQWEKTGDIFTEEEWNNPEGTLTDHPQTSRNYALFSRLAGVRYQEGYEPVCEKRGIPDDVSQGVLDIWEEENDWCHSPSWISLDELIKFDFGANDTELRRSIEVMKNLGSGNDVRMVFFFDN